MDIKKLQKLHRDYLDQSHFDHLAFSQIDFDSQSFESWCFNQDSSWPMQNQVFFDLASLTKPLVLGTYFLKNRDKFTNEQSLLLEHRAGLPAYGALSKSNWKNQISSYQIKESPELYSDFSSLRLMLEIGGDKIQNDIQPDLKEIKFWKNLSQQEIQSAPKTGYRLGRAIHGVVHDPNAYTIDEFCSHAGLFGTIEGVSQTLIGLNENYQLLKAQSKRDQRMFFEGWEGVSDPETTLAGKGAGNKTFGFLGFTGTSIWIDPQKNRGWVLLTNVTKEYWYEREKLNQLRRKSGELVWSN